MSGRFSARAWNTRASIYMPVPAIAHAMRAPKGPVAVANRPGRLKIPAPTIEPTTMAVSDGSGSFCSVVEETEGAEDAVEDVIFSSPSGRGHEAQRPSHTVMRIRSRDEFHRGCCPRQQ